MQKSFFEKDKFKEITIELDNRQCMIALINENLGWLMYMSEKEDISYSSRNPDFKDAEGDVEFLLSNGQRDEYPLAWLLPLDLVIKAINYFEEKQELPPFIEWEIEDI